VVSVPVTVTVNEQVTPTSVEQTTVVVPTGKKEPDGGLQLQGFGSEGSFGSPQLPVVVGEGYVTTAPHPLPV
jgi:hypothetical protein